MGCSIAPLMRHEQATTKTLNTCASESAAGARGDRPLRVFVGTFEISGFTYEIADGIERLGHEVNTGLRMAHANFEDRVYNLDLTGDTGQVDWDALSREIHSGAFHSPKRFSKRGTATDRMRWILARHDVFVFVYGSLWQDRITPLKFQGQGREYPLLERLGKRIVSYFVGPDARHATAYDQHLAHLGGDFRPLGEILPSWGADPVARAMRNVRRAERYASAIFSQPNQAGLAMRPYAHLHAPVDMSRLTARVPGREVPLIVHAPSERTIKGTDDIVAALERLRAEGHRFELRLLTDVPNSEVLAALADADVVIDQLHLPMHGRLGVEAMASGCALVTADRADLEPVPAHRPVWPVDPRSVEAQLRAIVSDRDLRVRLAHEGIAHARRYHDHVAVARRIVECVRDPAASLDHAPTFFAEHYRLPEGVKLPSRLKALTEQVARRWGLPEGVTLDDLRARGLA